MLLIKNISKRTILFAVAILLAAAFLCGCVPKNYSKSQEDALVEECMPAIQEFLADRYGDYQMGEFHLLKGQIEPDKPLYGRYGSNVVNPIPNPQSPIPNPHITHYYKNIFIKNT